MYNMLDMEYIFIPNMWYSAFSRIATNLVKKMFRCKNRPDTRPKKVISSSALVVKNSFFYPLYLKIIIFVKLEKLRDVCLVVCDYG